MATEDPAEHPTVTGDEEEEEEEDRTVDLDAFLGERKSFHLPLRYRFGDGPMQTRKVSARDYDEEIMNTAEVVFQDGGILIERRAGGTFRVIHRCIFKGIACWGLIRELDVVVDRRGHLVEDGLFHDLVFDYMHLRKNRDAAGAVESIADLLSLARELEADAVAKGAAAASAAAQ